MCAVLYSFTLDDAYITLRYSKHFANGQGLVWNPGTQNAVEGFTSLTWTLIGAIPHFLNLPPVQFIKIFSILAGILTIIILYTYGVYREKDRLWIFILAGALSFNPAFAFLTIQGMETTFASLLVLLSTVSCLEYIRLNETKFLFPTTIFLALGMLTRPGIVLYAIGMMAGIAAYKYSEEGIGGIKKPLKYGTAFLFVPGIAYIAFNTLYYGYPAPNSFYIKDSSSFIVLESLKDVGLFFILLCAPYLGLGIFSKLSESKENLEEDLQNLSPILAGLCLFLGLWLFVKPIQGFLYRFQMPVYASILALLYSTDVQISERIRWGLNLKTVVGLSMAFMLASIPMHTGLEVYHAWHEKSQVDRVEAGKALQEFSNENYTMFVSESGALPYYSEWRSYDRLGLNSEHIAHEGADKKFMKKISPDLMVFLSVSRFIPSESKTKYLDFDPSTDYRFVTAIQKTRNPNHIHVYYIKEELADTEIPCRLRNMDVKYVEEYEVSPKYVKKWSCDN